MGRVKKPFRIAVAQLSISWDIKKNGSKVRKQMCQAAGGGARLIQFPEGTLSGYAKSQVADWSEVNWHILKEELEAITKLASELKLWVVLGSAHPLTPPHWPHNSLYIISDEGNVVNRYDKRMCSYNETTNFYSPGTAPVIFDVDGFRFGCLICIEINFPELFMEYGKLGVDCLLLSAYPEAKVFHTKALAHAAIHIFWIGLSIPSERASMFMSGLINPDGELVASVTTDEGLIITDMDKNDDGLDIALNKARPWRAVASSGEFYKDYRIDDVRSSDRACI